VGRPAQPREPVALTRKFFYICTCEYCFSHYVAAGVVAVTAFRLLLDDWRGYVIAWFAVVAVANLYMSLYSRLRVDIKSEGLEAKVKEQDLAIKAQVAGSRPANREQSGPVPAEVVAGSSMSMSDILAIDT
jgi:hypothetical protein